MGISSIFHTKRRILISLVPLLFILSSLPAKGSVQVPGAGRSTTALSSTDTRILRLDVEIKTRNEADAEIGSHHLIPGTDHVWLDLGFKAWDLSSLPTVTGGKVFHKKGAVDRWEKLPLPETEAMTTKDLFELRLEKKGIGGFTHAVDGFNGGWKPESVTLFVNGQPFEGTLNILPSGQELDQSRPAWRHLFRTISAEDRFLLGLRIEPIPGGTSRFEKLMAFLTTPFKKLNITGWQNGPLKQYSVEDQFTSDGDVKDDQPIEHVSVQARLYKAPQPGTDNYVSLDLRLETVTIFHPDGTKTEHRVDVDNGVPHRRFIRAEYYRRKKGEPKDNRYKTEKWSIGDRFYAEGKILWDTDHSGFYEIHPDFGPAYLQRLK